MANEEHKRGAFEKKWLTFDVIALAQFHVDKNTSLSGLSHSGPFVEKTQILLQELRPIVEYIFITKNSYNPLNLQIIQIRLIQTPPIISNF